MDYRKIKRWMRCYAKHHDIPVPRGLRLSGHWGRYAQQLCRDIQKSKGWKPTGLPDYRLVVLVKPFRFRLMRVVRQELGTKEWPPGSNSGPVMKYLESVGFTFPTPWCASFVHWCLFRAGWSHGWPRLRGWVPSWDEFLKKYEVPKLKARNGDIVTFNFDRDPSSEHIGFVTKNYGPLKEIATIEGNATTPAVPGGGVVRKTRLWSQVNHVYRLPPY